MAPYIIPVHCLQIKTKPKRRKCDNPKVLDLLNTRKLTLQFFGTTFPTRPKIMGLARLVAGKTCPALSLVRRSTHTASLTL